MSAATIPAGWRLEEDEQHIHPGRVVRDYPCGCEAGINPPHGKDERFRVAVWDEKQPGGQIDSILLTGDDDDGYKTMDEAVAACDAAVADHKPVERIDIGEAYKRIEEGETLTADVRVPRSAIEELCDDNWLGNFVGDVEFQYSTSGDITIKLRGEE